MKITIKETEGRANVALEGMLDTNSSAEFLQKVTSLIDGGANDINFDLAGLMYISSQGIRTFLAIIKTMMAKNGKLVFRNIKPAVKDILDMSGLTQVMNIE